MPSEWLEAILCDTDCRRQASLNGMWGDLTGHVKFVRTNFAIDEPNRQATRMFGSYA